MARAAARVVQCEGDDANQHEQVQGGIPMVIQFMDSAVGAQVYVNPAFVVTVRPDPTDPDHLSLLKLEDGETVPVRGDHRQVSGKLSPTPE